MNFPGGFASNQGVKSFREEDVVGNSSILFNFIAIANSVSSAYSDHSDARPKYHQRIPAKENQSAIRDN